MVFCLISSEKASPLMLVAVRPWACAALWKAAVLYQPGVPALAASAGRSKNTPKVSAPQPKAALMRAARP
ncbi:hypothetical protein D3C77_789570 [compost metagenome]